MTNTSHRSEPSLPSILTLGGFTGLSMLLMLWMLTGPELTARGVVAAAGYLLLSLALFGQTIDRAYRRSEILERRYRAQRDAPVNGPVTNAQRAGYVILDTVNRGQDETLILPLGSRDDQDTQRLAQHRDRLFVTEAHRAAWADAPTEVRMERP